MKATLERLLAGARLSESEASAVLVALTDETLHPAMAGAVLAAMRTRGETPEEIRGFARAMRQLARRPDIPDTSAAVDVVGTGGDGSGSLNLSTGAALLAAACGQPVIKHGNRAVSSRSGSADVLERLGLAIPMDENAAGACLAETGFTFLFAPYYHPALKALAPVRRALGARTICNLLGPLSNPAQPPYLVLGVFSREAAELIARALAEFPIEHAFVIHGSPGWDEATPVGPFLILDVRPGRVEPAERDPADFGILRCQPEDLIGGDADANARRLRAALEGEPGPHADALALNAALALEVTGAAPSTAAALEVTRAGLAEGKAAQLVDRLADFSRKLKSRAGETCLTS